MKDKFIVIEESRYNGIIQKQKCATKTKTLEEAQEYVKNNPLYTYVDFDGKKYPKYIINEI